MVVVLAGEDGQRLLPLTRRLSSDDRPKRFCRFIGDETLLDQALRRIEPIVQGDLTFSVVTKAQLSLIRSDAIGLAPRMENSGDQETTRLVATAG